MDFDRKLEKLRIQLDPQEKKEELKCDRCGTEIYKDDDYYLYERNRLCEECFDDIQSTEKFECRRTAGDEDDY